MESAAQRSGRDPADIVLIAVTKTIPVDAIRPAVEAGARDLGENYYQEARDKLSAFGNDVRWHFIGHLQSNKARHVVGRFALIHSVDTPALAQEIGRRASAAGIVQDILLEVKIDPAPDKTGIAPGDVGPLAERIGAIDGLRLRGLMGMPPPVSDPALARPYFALLRSLLDDLPCTTDRWLSMGMTADFETAIEEGATHVRVGTAIFGPRS